MDGFIKSRKTPFFVIPAPHQMRDKLQPESRFSIGYRVSGLRPFGPELKAEGFSPE
jgi:hypothetical protein